VRNLGLTAPSALEHPFHYVNCIAGVDGLIGGDHDGADDAAEFAGESHHALLGALGIAFGDGDRALDRHAVDVRIAPGLLTSLRMKNGR
jgi:hypothetical protein